jgi:acyl-CoA synthetase (AMP-forming)/AMP-acid ligase II
MIWTSPYPDVPLDAATLPALVDDAVRRHPARTALIDGSSGAGVSYAELGLRIDRLAAWLADTGVRAGDTVALWTPNTPAWAAVALATMRLGAAVTGLNPAATAGEAATQLADTRATLAFTIPSLVPLARRCGVDRVLTVGRADGAVPLDEAFAAAGAAPRSAHDPAAVAMLPCSSGTTGPPKPVMLTHANIVTTLRQIGSVLAIGPADTTLAVAPFCHVLGSLITLAAPLAAGATVVTMPRFDPAEFLRLVEHHRVRFTAIPPPVAGVLAHHPASAKRDLSSLQLLAVGGAPLDPSMQAALEQRLPDCVIGQGWGLTETTGTICVPDRHRSTRPGSVGRPVPNTELRVVDPVTGAGRGPGETGELWVRGPQVMAGYLGRPDATTEMVDGDGWLHTGDLGHVEAGGDIVLVDRLKELIKVDAFQVAPAELEALLRSHPAVLDAAVVGRPHPRHGEVPVAFVVSPGHTGTRELLRWVSDRVAPYKRLAEITTVAELPRTASGKLLRRALR